MIPLARPFVGKEESALISQVLKSGWLTQGAKVTEFEKLLADYTGVKYAVALSSCTTALHSALLVLGVGPGDEVIVPSLSFIATANSVVHCGAKPIFVDIDQGTFNIDPALIEKAITKKTKVIMPVHQAGMPADMDRINAIAKKHGIKVMEDAACALGSRYKGRLIGSHSEMSCFSFHPRKIVTTAEGGMVTTNNVEHEKKLRLLRHHGMNIADTTRHNAKKMTIEHYPLIGYNYRMSDVHAAIGIVQIKRLDIMLKKRRELAMRYNEAFNTIPLLAIPIIPDYLQPNFQSYILRLKDDCPVSRDGMINRLLQKGISAKPGIMTIHREPAYKRLYPGLSLPQSESACDNCILLPLFYRMTFLQQKYVIASILEILKI